MAEAKTQADYRRDMVVADQFGRRWLLAIELKTGDPTGQIVPAGWSDPMRTPQQYLRVPKDAFGQPVWGRLEVNVKLWVQEIRSAMLTWKRRLFEIGQKQQGTKFDPAKAEEDEYLLHLAGPKPWPTEDAIRALAAGNEELQGKKPLTAKGRKILGTFELEDLDVLEKRAAATQAADRSEPPKEPARSPAMSYKEFASDLLKEGKSMAEVGALWKEHKAALAGES